MPVLFKPLFNPSLLIRRLAGFDPALPAELATLASEWARTVADPAFLQFNEKPLQGQFLTDIFARVLGYTPAVGHLDAYHLKPESASTETTRQASGQTEEAPAWAWLSERYPSLSAHLAPFADAARKRSDQGEFWWELRSCDYYPAFDEPQIFFPDIAKLPRFSWNDEGAYVNNQPLRATAFSRVERQ